MGTHSAPLAVLGAVFAMAGVQHLLIWARDFAARDHLWFGLAALAAAGAAAAQYMYADAGSESMTLNAHRLAIVCGVVWLVAVAWFTVDYASGDRTRHQAALLAVVLLATACVGNLAWSASTRQSPSAAQGLPLLLAILAIAIIFWLAIDGMLRLWSISRRIRALTLGGLSIGLSVVALGHGWGARGLLELSPSALYWFLLVIIAMTYELAGAMTDAKAVSRQQHQDLAHASRLSIVGELTASIAHEINQPLSAILSNADAGEILLGTPDPPMDEIRKILADIRRDGLRASGVIRHVRTLVRNRELDMHKLDANAVATGVIALLEPEARRRRVFIEAEHSSSPAWFHGDRALIEQALINLVLNAMDSVEAMDTADNIPTIGLPVVLAVGTTPHDEVEFKVVDAGQGIPAEHLEHLFDSFHTTKPHGMGLGLSISRSIVETHGGRIRAANNPGGGATFWIALPPHQELQR